MDCRSLSTTRRRAERAPTASSPRRSSLVARPFGLGRGLEALIPSAGETTSTFEIPVDRIARNPHQPRSRFDDAVMAELTASVAAHGVLPPEAVGLTVA